MNKIIYFWSEFWILCPFSKKKTKSKLALNLKYFSRLKSRFQTVNRRSKINGFQSKLDLLKIGERIRWSCAANIVRIICMQFQRNACIWFNHWMCCLHRDLWPFSLVEFLVVMWLAHSYTFLFNFQDNLGEMMMMCIRPIWHQFSMCKDKITTTVFFGSCFQICTQHVARTTPKHEFRFIFAL